MPRYLRRRFFSVLFGLLAICLLWRVPSLFAQTSTPHPESAIGGESRDYRSIRSGRWVDLSTWQVYRSGVWINAGRDAGVPGAVSNAFIEAGHTIIATRANTEIIGYWGSQALAFLDVHNLHISTQAAITTTWGSVLGGFASADWYDGDRMGGLVSTRNLIVNSNPNMILGNFDTFLRFGCLDCIPIPRPRNNELRIYGKLRYYAGSALDLSDHPARIQVTAATIGTGSTLVFRGVTRTITTPEEWSTTLATQTGYFDNTAYTASMLAFNPQERHNNFRGLMGRNSFWTAIFDLGRVVDRNFSTDQFTGATDDAASAVGTLGGTFTAGIIQVRRGTLRVEAPALLVNEGSVTSGVLHVMNNAVLQLMSANIGRTGVYREQFANGSADILRSTECRVTSRMRYCVIEEGGALDFAGRVGSLSAADVRFNGTVRYSSTANQTLVQDSPYLSYNPAGPVIAPGLCAGENGLFDPYNNNFNANPGVLQQGDPTNGVMTRFGSSPAGLGVGTAALFQPSTTAAYSHLILSGSGTKFLPVTTVTISRALIMQGEAQVGLQNLAYPGIPASAFSGNSSQQGTTPILPYFLSQPLGGELRTRDAASKAGFFPPLVYLRSTGLTGFREENNCGTTLRTSLSADNTENFPANATPQPMWSVYGGNTDPVAFVGFTTASTRIIIYDQNLYPEGASFPVGITLSAATNREQMDMSPSVKTPVVHGLPAEPSYYSTTNYSTNGTAHGHGFSARAIFYGESPQTLDGTRFGQVIRQTLDRVNGTQTAISPMQIPTLGTSNFVNGFPVITNSLYNAPINTTATTTLQYDSEKSDVMSQREFPSGVWGPHNLVMNCPLGTLQTLPVRTADAQTPESRINWGIPHLNFANRTNVLTSASTGTIIIGPEHVITANGHLPRHAFDPRTGLFQPQAVYIENENGQDTITPGTLASAFIDTRPDFSNPEKKLFDRYFSTGIGLRPANFNTSGLQRSSIDDRVRAALPEHRIRAASVVGTTQTLTITAPNDFGRRGDMNNFGVVELRSGILAAPQTTPYTFSLSSTAIISAEQQNISLRNGTPQTRLPVALSDANGSLDYPNAAAWQAAGVRLQESTRGTVIRGASGPAYLQGSIAFSTFSSLVITGGTGGTIDVASDAASRSAMLQFATPSSINTGFDELPATLGIPGLTAFPPTTNDQVPNGFRTVNAAPDPNGFNNAWNLDLPLISGGIGNLTMLRGTSNILTLVGGRGNDREEITSPYPKNAGLEVLGTIATARGSIDLNGRNIELSGVHSRLIEAFERTATPQSVLNRHPRFRAYIGTSNFRTAEPLDSARAARLLAQEGLPLAFSFAGLGISVIRLNVPMNAPINAPNDDTTRFRIRRWQVSTTASLTRSDNPLAVAPFLRFWQVETRASVSSASAFGVVLNYTDADIPPLYRASDFAVLRGFAPFSLFTFRPDTKFQALRTSDGLSMRRYKQAALLTRAQTLENRTVDAAGAFSLAPDTSGRGFNLWTLGIPAPTTLVLRGQRFGGKFGDPIGAGFEGAGMDIVGFPRPFGSFTVDAPFGGISRETAEQYGAIIGPFKAGVPTCATIVGEVLDELGNTAQFAPTTGAALVVGQVGGGIGPWNTGVPQIATWDFRFLRIWNTNSSFYSFENGGDKIGAFSRNGRFEWANVGLQGIASTTVTMSLTNDLIDTVQFRTTTNPNATLRFADTHPVQVSLQGGFPFSETFATQHTNNSNAVQIYPGAQGPFAAPGKVAATPGVENSGYDGSIPTNLTGTPTGGIIVGEVVRFPYSSPGYSSITGIIKDRFGNYPSFPTTATIGIAGGSPPVDQLRTPLVGQQARSAIVWGLGNLGNENQLARVGSFDSPLHSQNAAKISPALAPTGLGYPPITNPQIQNHIVSFPNFQIWGATSSYVTLFLSADVSSAHFNFGFGAGFEFGFGGSSKGNTSATINILPNRAIGIAPVLVADPYNNNRLDRMPSKMFIGKSNANDPRTWFYVQAVDEFGNRVNNGPHRYNGGTAHIRFALPEEGLPKSRDGRFQFTSSRDPYTKRNNQQYSARGLSARAVDGLYTFNDFTPLGPASIDALGNDVVLTFEDDSLRGMNAPRNVWAIPLYRPIPPITTAITTFLEAPRLTLAVSDSVLNGARKAAPNGLLLKERARTYLSTENSLETGFLEIQRPVTARAFDLPVVISTEYFTTNGGFDTASFRVRNPALFTPLPLQGRTALELPAPIVTEQGNIVPQLFPPFPSPQFTAINGVQGDLAPLALGRTPTALTREQTRLAFDSGAVTQRIRFSARFSDQVYPRNPARQGLRLAVVRLRADSSAVYTTENDSTLANDSALVVLADPSPVAPRCINPFADRQMLIASSNPVPIQETVELETPEWRLVGRSSVPQTVFYDDNYEPLRYAVSSSDTTLVQAFITPADMRFAGRPTLTTIIPPLVRVETSASIIVSASDGVLTARDTFLVVLRRPVGVLENKQGDNLSSASNLILSVMPNPLQHDSFVEIIAPESGLMRFTAYNSIGAVVLSEERFVHRFNTERFPLRLGNTPTGMYLLEARMETRRGILRETLRVVKP